MPIRALLILLCLLLIQCTSYPNGTSMPGDMSFQKGSLVEWQRISRDNLLSLLDLKEKDLTATRKTEVHLSYPSVKKIRKHFGKRGILNDSENGFCEEGELVLLEAATGVYLRECADGATTVRVLSLSYPGVGQRWLEAYLLIPQLGNPLEQEKKTIIKVPSVVYLHGHSALKEDGAFNKDHYLKGMGLMWAQKGHVVLIPSHRGFEKDNKKHLEEAKNLEEMGQNYLTVAALDALYAQSILESFPFEKLDEPLQVDLRRNAIVGVSLGGQVALLAGSLDERFDFVGTHGSFYGYEALFSKHHHECQHVPKLKDHFNIFDVGLMIHPRQLHVAMGGQDKFFNDYSVTALKALIEGWEKGGGKACQGESHEYTVKDTGEDFMNQLSISNNECNLHVEISGASEHNFIGLGAFPY